MNSANNAAELEREDVSGIKIGLSCRLEKYMGFAGVEGTSGYRTEETGTKTQRQKYQLDCCRSKELAWLRIVFACEGGVRRGLRCWVQWSPAMEGLQGRQRNGMVPCRGRSSILTNPIQNSST